MTWMLMDEMANAIAAYDDKVAAHAGLRAVVADDVDARDSLLLLEYDDEGNPVGEAVAFDDLPASTVNMREATSDVTVFLFRTTVGLGGAARNADVTTFARPVHVATQGVVPVPAP